MYTTCSSYGEQGFIFHKAVFICLHSVKLGLIYIYKWSNHWMQQWCEAHCNWTLEPWSGSRVQCTVVQFRVRLLQGDQQSSDFISSSVKFDVKGMVFIRSFALLLTSSENNSYCFGIQRQFYFSDFVRTVWVWPFSVPTWLSDSTQKNFP